MSSRAADAALNDVDDFAGLPQGKRLIYRHLPDQRRWWAWSLVGAGLLVYGLILSVVVIRWIGIVDASDLPVNIWFFTRTENSDIIRAWALDFQLIGSLNVTGPVGALFLLLLLVLKKFRWAAWFFIVAVGGAVTSEVLKHFVERARPVWGDPIFVETGYSYTSGHTLSGITTWAAIGIALLYILPRPWSTYLGWIFIVFGVLLGPSRWFLGVHWMTDVLGGWIFGIGWLLLVSGFFIRLLPAVSPSKSSEGSQA